MCRKNIFAFSVRNQLCVFIKDTLQTDPLGWISPQLLSWLAGGGQSTFKRRL